MKHKTITIPAEIQAQADAFMANARARFGHDAFRMEDAGGDGDGAGDAGDDGGNSDDADAAALGDKGKQALDRMKTERKEAERRAKAAEAELEKLRNASKTEQEKAIDAARKEGESEATKRANERLVRAEVKAIAAGAKFRDPSDVIAQLGSQLKDVAVDEDGEVDQKALKGLVDSLAKSKPYLVDTGSTTATAADAGIGTTGTNTKPDPGPGRARLASAYAGTSKP